MLCNELPLPYSKLSVTWKKVLPASKNKTKTGRVTYLFVTLHLAARLGCRETKGGGGNPPQNPLDWGPVVWRCKLILGKTIFRIREHENNTTPCVSVPFFFLFFFEIHKEKQRSLSSTEISSINKEGDICKGRFQLDGIKLEESKTRRSDTGYIYTVAENVLPLIQFCLSLSSFYYLV